VHPKGFTHHLPQYEGLWLKNTHEALFLPLNETIEALSASVRRGDEGAIFHIEEDQFRVTALSDR